MSRTKEISILRLVIDLIKADNKIHREEVSWIEELNARYNFSEKELREVHNITFGQAISNLQNLEEAERREIVAHLQEIISVDNDIDVSERLLLATIRLSLQQDTCRSVQILTTESQHFANYDRQLIYLEKNDCKMVKEAILQAYNGIERSLRSCEIDLFFIPKVVELFARSHPYVNSTIELLLPTFCDVRNIVDGALIEQCRTTDFCDYLATLMGKNRAPFLFDSFFMIKIQESGVAGNNMVDFLCIDCAANPVAVIDTLVESLTCNFTSEAIPYEGCYRTFFDMLSVLSKQSYNLLLDDMAFYLDGRDRIELNIRGSERKTLFTLFLLHGVAGIGNDAFASLSKDTPLGKEVIAIYRYFANEKNEMLVEDALLADMEPAVITNLRDIVKRNSHIGYIKKAFTMVDSLRDPHLYYPQNIKEEHSYNILLPAEKVKIVSIPDGCTTILSLSHFL